MPTTTTTASRDSATSATGTDPLASNARVVEWYRIDPARRIFRVLIPASLVLTVGSLLVSHGIALGELSDRNVLLAAIGLLLVIVGPLAAIIGLTRVLGVEDYLILRTDGVLYYMSDGHRLLPWDELHDVRHDDEQDAIVLRLDDGEEMRVEQRFSGITARDLAERLDEVRRKAIWNLLPEQR